MIPNSAVFRHKKQSIYDDLYSFHLHIKIPPPWCLRKVCPAVRSDIASDCISDPAMFPLKQGNYLRDDPDKAEKRKPQEAEPILLNIKDSDVSLQAFL